MSTETTVMLLYGALAEMVQAHEGRAYLDPTCQKCTGGQTPHGRDAGPCAYHIAKQVLRLVGKPELPSRIVIDGLRNMAAAKGAK